MIEEVLILTQCKSVYGYYKLVYNYCADTDKYKPLYLSPKQTFAVFKEARGQTIYYPFIFYDSGVDYEVRARRIAIADKELVSKTFKILNTLTYNNDIGIKIRQASGHREVEKQ